MVWPQYFILAVIGIFAQDVFLHQASPHRGDIPLQFYPWKQYVRASLAEGELPYWNPYTFGGTPLLANMQSAVFYPLDWLLFLFPMERFYGLSLVLHLWLAGIGAFLFARKCGASSFPAMIAGVAYGLNGFTAIHIPAGNHLTYAGAAWVPWMFFIALGFAQARWRLPWALGGAMVVFLHFLCGHPQMTFYSLFFSVVFCLVYGLWNAWYKEKSILRRSVYPNQFLRDLSRFGNSIGWISVAPDIGISGRSQPRQHIERKRRDRVFIRPPSIDHASFSQNITARCSGGIITIHFTIGPTPMRERLSPFWQPCYLWRAPLPPAAIPLAGTALLGLFLAWGRGNPVYTMLLHLPGFGHFRAPAKFLPYYIAPVCALASLGVDWISGRVYYQQCKKPEICESFVQKYAIIILLLLLYVILHYGGQRLLDATEYLRTLDGIQEKNMIRSFSIAQGFLLALSGFTLFLFARRVTRYPRLAISFSFALLVTMDLFVFGKGYLDICLRRPETIRIQSAVPQEIGYIKSQTDNNLPFRVITLKEIEYPNLFITWENAESLRLRSNEPAILQSIDGTNGRLGRRNTAR